MRKALSTRRRQPLLHPSVVVELVFLEILDRLLTETVEKKSTQVQQSKWNALSLQLRGTKHVYEVLAEIQFLLGRIDQAGSNCRSLHRRLG